MTNWFRGKPGGLLALLLIGTLMFGGLGWATTAALRLEREQAEERRQSKIAEKLRLALWRLDSRVSPLLAREDSRPYDHFSAISAPPVAFDNFGRCQVPGTVLQPSPLLDSDLPSWMLLHFLVHPTAGMSSPQVPAEQLVVCLNNGPQPALTENVTDKRQALLREFASRFEGKRILEEARTRTVETLFRERTLVPSEPFMRANQGGQAGFPAQQQAVFPQQPGNPQQTENYQNLQEDLRNEFNARVQSRGQSMPNKSPKRYNRDLVTGNTVKNGSDWLTSNPRKISVGAEVLVHLSPLVVMWLEDNKAEDRLVALRLVKIEEDELCQCIALDARALEKLLLDEIVDLFPHAMLLPVTSIVPQRPERTMTALPFELVPGTDAVAVDSPGWTPLRVGLALAWVAVVIALLAVALGGWSLLDLSERRIGFVSAVTHELRSPLTTLRLYLDMLTGGMVKDEQQKQEYLETLHSEADRLNRLVSNVLDFSRLENQSPKLIKTEATVESVLSQLGETWQPRCRHSEKVLLLENETAEETVLNTDHELLIQVVGNLLDNACKYSMGSTDSRVRVRVTTEGSSLVIDVRDYGPGIPVRDRKSIFRAFRRGSRSDATGGVGLGLALVARWMKLLGGSVTLTSEPGPGACFQLRLPL